MANSPKSKTDWGRVKRETAAEAPIPYEPEDGPYDPNDDVATEAYLEHATRYRGGRGPQKSPTKELISIRLSREVLDHFRSTGEGWQTRLDEMLKQAIEKKRKRR